MSAEPPSSDASPRKLSQLVQRLDETLRSRGPGVLALNAVYEFQLLEPDSGTVRVDLREGQLSVLQGKATQAPPADCRLVLTCDDFMDLFEGRVSAQALFSSGKLRIDGDFGLVMKLKPVTELFQ